MKVSTQIYSGDLDFFEFNQESDFEDFISNLKDFKCVWLVTGESDEVLVTKDCKRIIDCFKIDLFGIKISEDKTLLIQEYQSYDEAYTGALYSLDN